MVIEEKTSICPCLSSYGARDIPEHPPYHPPLIGFCNQYDGACCFYVSVLINNYSNCFGRFGTMQ